MAHSPKFTAPSAKSSTQAPIFTDPGAMDEVKLSPRVEALRKLVASGQYQVSPRHLAHQIMRAAGVKVA
jgi:anti-sigma28 factor (negative regulator of flagellin synthesis)